MRYILVLSFLFNGYVFSQTPTQSYEIKSVGSNHSISEFHEAFQIADFLLYRLNNERRSLIFTDGSEVLLLSTSELSLPPVTERYPTKNVYPTRFSISDSGYLIELFENTDKSKRGNY